MPAQDKRDLFRFMLSRVKETQKDCFDGEPQAFGRWFARLFFMSPQDIFVSDGAKDGKIDLFFTTHNGKSVMHHVLNTKYTHEFNKIAPPSFYQEIKYFWQVFENSEARSGYLEKAVCSALRARYHHLFERYDNGAAELMFVTNHRCNEAHFEQIRNVPVKVFHLDDLIQCLVDDIDGAMPRTPPISLHGVHAVLAPDKADTEVATSIVFARLIDFLHYMEGDPFDLLFNRNVRVAISLSRSLVNRSIRDTFKGQPKEFAFSNNGITMLCEKQHYDPGNKVLTLENPRVVNGSQTLHSIREVASPSPNARVMVRIIEIEPPHGDGLEEQIKRRKEIINRIAVRSNQQNPIKAWDLVANDDYQLELFRFFRGKGFFYERRDSEWRHRSKELRSVKIEYGSSIKRLSQLIASYHWSKAKPRLGPAIAKRVKDLFEGAVYEAICETKPEIAFQVFLIGENVSECVKALGREKRYIFSLKSYSHLAVFALVVKAMQHANAGFGDPSLTEMLLKQWSDWYPSQYKSWKDLTKACIDHVILIFEKESIRYSKREGEELTYANYFKSQTYMSRLLEFPLDKQTKGYARQVLEG